MAERLNDDGEPHALDPGRAALGATRRLLQERCHDRLAGRRDGRPLVIEGLIVRAVVFKAGRNPVLARDFVRLRFAR